MVLLQVLCVEVFSIPQVPFFSKFLQEVGLEEIFSQGALSSPLSMDLSKLSCLEPPRWVLGLLLDPQFILRNISHLTSSTFEPAA
jgi:hypothetical protein